MATVIFWASSWSSFGSSRTISTLSLSTERSLTIPKDISLLLDIRGRRFLNARYSFKEPIFAPIKKGDSIGKIVILNDNDIIVETILISNEDIGVKNIVGKAIGAARYLIN